MATQFAPLATQTSPASRPTRLEEWEDAFPKLHSHVENAARAGVDSGSWHGAYGATRLKMLPAVVGSEVSDFVPQQHAANPERMRGELRRTSRGNKNNSLQYQY
ncbi:unnamed protein product [Lampetra planeri]